MSTVNNGGYGEQSEHDQFHRERSHHYRGVEHGDESGAGSRPVGPAISNGDYPAKVVDLIEQAHLAAYEGRIEDSERLLRNVLAYGEIPTVLNNLALVHLQHYNEPSEALCLLNRNLDNPSYEWHPFTESLAAICFARLARTGEARDALERAIKSFEYGLADLSGAPWKERRAWQEYTTKILRAAGEIGDHRKVWDLYQRWAHHHVLPSSHECGGTAAFNLQKFRSARVAWRRARSGSGSYLRAYMAVAGWCEEGLAEPLTLDYYKLGPDASILLLPLLAEVNSGRRPAASGDGQRGADSDRAKVDRLLAELAAYLHHPANRVAVFWSMFHAFVSPDRPGESNESDLQGVQAFMAAGGDWAEASARRLFLSPKVNPDAKVAAWRGLVRAGRQDPNQPLSMWWDGHVQDVAFAIRTP